MLIKRRATKSIHSVFNSDHKLDEVKPEFQDSKLKMMLALG